jgi:hypothetical protein
VTPPVGVRNHTVVLMRTFAKVPRVIMRVIATARTVAVEILERDPMFEQVLFRRRGFLNASGREMWSVVTLSPKIARGRARLIS